MKYNNKLELIDAIKSNADLFIREYSDIKDEAMDTTYEEIEYSPYQMLAFCIGWMDLVLSWEEEELKGIQKTPLATEWKWNNLDWLYQSFYDRYNNNSLKEIYNALTYIEPYKESLQSYIYDHIQEQYKPNNECIFYDVTNYYFEIDDNDDFR